MINSTAYIVPGIINLTDPISAIRIVLSDYNMSLDEICRKTRKKSVVQYRQVIQTILSRHTKMSLSEIGKIIGGKDHATVLHSKDVINNTEFLFKKRMIKEDLYVLYSDIETKYLELTAGSKQDYPLKYNIL